MYNILIKPFAIRHTLALEGNSFQESLRSIIYLQRRTLILYNIRILIAAFTTAIIGSPNFSLKSSRHQNKNNVFNIYTLVADENCIGYIVHMRSFLNFIVLTSRYLNRLLI